MGCQQLRPAVRPRRHLFRREPARPHIDHDKCVGCGRCIGACNFDAICLDQLTAPTTMLNCKMAEYAKAVVDGRPNFHINLVMDVSPNCDCHAENDAPILPDVGMFASFDPVALDQACADACLAPAPYAGQPAGGQHGQARLLTTTTTTSPTPPRNPSGDPAWSTPRRSAWAAGAMS